MQRPIPYPDQETTETVEAIAELEAYGQDVELDDDARALVRALLDDVAGDALHLTQLFN